MSALSFFQHLKWCAPVALLVVLVACGGGGGGSTTAGGDSAGGSNSSGQTITTSGGTVTVNNLARVSFSQDAVTKTAQISATIQPASDTAALTNVDINLDLTNAVLSNNLNTAVTVYFHASDFKTAPTASIPAASQYPLLGPAALVSASNLMIAVAKVGSKFVEAPIVFDPVKNAYKANFTSLAFSSLGTIATSFVVAVYESQAAQNADTTTKLYRWDSATSLTEISAREVTTGKIPLVLVHGVQIGLSTCGQTTAYKDTWISFANLYFQSALNSKYTLYSFAYPTNVGVAANGSALASKINTVFGAMSPAVVLAHSMGGLVTRAADTPAINIEKIITLNTPHHGTLYISSSATARQSACIGFASSQGALDMRWDGADGTPSDNTTLKNLGINSGKIIPYSSSFDIDSTCVLKHSVFCYSREAQSLTKNKGDGAVIIPSQRFFLPAAWSDRSDWHPNWSVQKKEYAGLDHSQIHDDRNVFVFNADGTAGGLLGDLNAFYSEINASLYPVQIASVTCPSAIATQPVTCTVTGSNLPITGLTASLGSASCTANTGASATSQAFTCTPAASGSLNFTVNLNGAAVSGSPKVVLVAAANAPAISSAGQPTSQSVMVGQTATFSVVATGTGTLTYQWKKNGTSVTTGIGGTSASYTTPIATMINNGDIYTVTVSNSVGSTTSSNAILIINNSNGVASLVLLPDTGIINTQCFIKSQNSLGQDVFNLGDCYSISALTSGNYQDGMVIRPSISYSNIQNFPLTSCVKDDITKLIWEGKENSGIRSFTETYTHNVFNKNDTNGADAYVAYVNKISLCGYADWRIPTVDELLTIVLYRPYMASGILSYIDINNFPNTPAGFSFDNLIYWDVSYILSNYKSPLRLVRGAIFGNQTKTYNYISQPYVYNGQTDAANNVAIDALTGIQWRRCLEGQIWNGTSCLQSARTFSLSDALLQLNNITGSGYWRLPDVRELGSLPDRTLSSSEMLSSTAFPGSSTSSYIWASTPGITTSLAALAVNMRDGTIVKQSTVYATNNLRLIRMP
jgi:Protein of unknown function (DUF1566)/Immunoglobulin I-set domain